jgi:hypothetical protein
MNVMKLETRLLLRAILSDRPVIATMTVLGSVVCAFIGLFVATHGQPDQSFWFAVHSEIGLSRDRSMGEILNYGLAFLASVLFFLVFIESRSPMFFFFSILMAFIWFDDSASYHERFGRFLDRTISLPALPGTRQQDTGELIAWAIAGSILACFLLPSLLRRRPGDLGALVLVTSGFAALIFFGMLADMVHIAAPPELDFEIGVIEDGGEMLAITFIAGVALGLVRNYQSYCKSIAGIA